MIERCRSPSASEASGAARSASISSRLQHSGGFWTAFDGLTDETAAQYPDSSGFSTAVKEANDFIWASLTLHVDGLHPRTDASQERKPDTMSRVRSPTPASLGSRPVSAMYA